MEKVYNSDIYNICSKCGTENLVNDGSLKCSNCKAELDKTQDFFKCSCSECKTQNRVYLQKDKEHIAPICGKCGSKLVLFHFAQKEDLKEPTKKQESKTTNKESKEPEIFMSRNPIFQTMLFSISFLGAYLFQDSGNKFLPSFLISIGIGIGSLFLAYLLELFLFLIAYLLTNVVFISIILFCIFSLIKLSLENNNSRFSRLLKNKFPNIVEYKYRIPSRNNINHSIDYKTEVRNKIEDHGYNFDRPEVVYRSEGYSGFSYSSNYIKRYGFLSKRLVAEIIKTNAKELKEDCDLNYDKVNAFHYRQAYELIQADRNKLIRAHNSLLQELYQKANENPYDPVDNLCNLHTGFCMWESYLISTGDANIASAYLGVDSTTYKIKMKQNSDPLLFNVKQQCGKTEYAGVLWISPEEFEIENK